MRRTAGIFMAAVLVLGGLAACGSTAAKGDPQAAPTSDDGSTSSTATGPTSAGSSDPACAAVAAVLQQSDDTGDESNDYPALAESVEAARPVVPAELSGALDAVADFARSQVDGVGVAPMGTTASAEAMVEFGRSIESMTHAGYDLDSWYRHHCGPDSASSPWCDALGAAQVDRGLVLAEVFSTLADPGAAPNAGLGRMDEADAAFFVALRAAAPEDLWPPLDVIVGQYQANGGTLPEDDASTAAIDDAKSTISASVATDCGDTLSHLD